MEWRPHGAITWLAPSQRNVSPWTQELIGGLIFYQHFKLNKWDDDPMIPFKGLLQTWMIQLIQLYKHLNNVETTNCQHRGETIPLLVEECWYSYHIHLIVTIVIITRHHPWCFLCGWLLLLSWRSSLPGTWTIYMYIYIYIYNDDITIHYIYIIL